MQAAQVISNSGHDDMIVRSTFAKYVPILPNIAVPKTRHLRYLYMIFDFEQQKVEVAPWLILD